MCTEPITTVTLDALPDEAPQELATEIAERRRLVVVNGEIVRSRTQLFERHHSFNTTASAL